MSQDCPHCIPVWMTERDFVSKKKLYLVCIYFLNKKIFKSMKAFTSQKKESLGWVRWLMPVIPVLWEAKEVDHEVKRLRRSWPI